MSKNIEQIFTDNPTSSMVSNDLLYLGRSPYGITDDYAITFLNFVGSIGASSPTASTIARWDANKNLSANNFLSSYTTTATAASNTILTVASTQQQYFTGTTTQTVTLPVVSTLVLGFSYTIVNNSTGVVTVNSSGGNLVEAMGAGTQLVVTCIAITGTSSASWDTDYTADILPVPPNDGGTGVANLIGSTITVGGAFSMVGAYTFAGTLTGNTAVTFPTSGTLATTSSASGIINPGLINQLAWYAGAGTTLSGLATVTSAVLVTSAGGVPSLSITLPSGLAMGTPASIQLTNATGLVLTSGYGVTGILPSGYGGTGINNGSNTLTLAGNLATSGAYASTFTMTGATNVTFPTSGTLATTSTASGIVNSGLINQLAWYAAAGTTLSGLATANSGVLVTSSGGVPSISTTLPSGLAATNMSLTTPSLGVATATSINFGVSALSNYVTAGTWTPVFSFSTAGDVSVSYSNQSGQYTQIGNIVVANFIVSGTVTYTTASGSLEITGLPLTVNNTCFGTCYYKPTAFPTGTTSVFLQAQGGGTLIYVGANGSLVNTAYVSTSQVTSGTVLNIQGTVTYLI